MRTKFRDAPRRFIVSNIEILDCGEIFLEPNEQITFKAGSYEYDICKKEWGFYATPSVNGRLKKFGYKTAIVQNPSGKVFVMLVESLKLGLFKKYLESEGSRVLAWLDEISSGVHLSGGV